MTRMLSRAVLAVLGVAIAVYAGKVLLFGTGVGILGTQPHPCDTNGACFISAKVDVTGLIGCIVTSDYNKITVGKGFKPKLVWKIDTAPGDRSDYWFDNDGIRLNPKDHNEEDKDLHDGKHDHPQQKHYKWDNHNSRPKEIHFDVYIRRTVVGSGHDPMTSIPCDARDPLIANAGN